MLPFIPGNPLIDLICYDNKVMFSGDIGDDFQIGFRVYRTGRVLRGIDKYCLGAVGDGGLELFLRPAKIILTL